MALSTGRWPAAIGLLGLIAISLASRTGGLDVGLWIDEGLSIGIASRAIPDIPATLRLDGSPPLYYVLLHFWMEAFGQGEIATRALSLLFACACVPVSWWLVRATFGSRAAWAAATVFAVNPFLTQYAQETRMYSLVVLLGLIATVCFIQAFVWRRRRWLVGLVAACAALLYTHNWALFFSAGLGLTWLALAAAAPDGKRRGVLRDGVVAFALIGLLYLPWLPTLIFQARHTGAPWALRPGIEALWGVFASLLGTVPQLLLLVTAGAGLVAIFRARPAGASQAGAATDPSNATARAVWALLALETATLVIAWLSSQLSPAWAVRYLAVGVAPLLVLAAVGLSRAGGLGFAGLAIVALWSAFDAPPPSKSNVLEVATAIAPGLRAGDVVVSTQPEQVPVLNYYLPEGVRFATLWGELADPKVTDWRDGAARMSRTSARRDLAPLASRLNPGQRLVLVEPIIYKRERWSAPWTQRVRLKSVEWRDHLFNRSDLRTVAMHPLHSYPPKPNPVRATVFVRVPTR